MIGVMGIVISEAAEEPEDGLGGDSTTCQRSNGWTHASINTIIS